MRSPSNTVLVFLLCLAPGAALAEVVGNVGAVNQSAKGAPPGGSAHMLSLGLGVVDQERIETGADGKAQIVFKDQSTISVGAGSSVKIDRFVYDGHSSSGKQSVSIAKGALRFIGGSVSHGQGSDIKTPAASIGVRGGMVEVILDRPCPNDGNCEEIVLLSGRATILAAAGTTELTRPGFSVTIDAHGNVSEPAPVAASTLDALETSFASLPGQTGGASPGAIPTAANLETALGNFRLPEQAPWAGLGAIGAHWAGRGVAQSHAQSLNQGAATKTQQTVAAIAAAAQSRSANAPSSTPTIGFGAPTSGSSLPAGWGPFSHGFCVWGCVTPTYVSSNYPANGSAIWSVVYRADFTSSGHGYFLITFTFTPTAWSVTGTSSSTGGSGSGSGTLGMGVAYFPPGGGSQTNSYNVAFRETYSFAESVAGTTPTLTSWSISGGDTLNYVNVSGIANLAGMSSNSFFNLANGFGETFNYHYP